MEYCLDTGDLEMVKKVADLYPIRCFSMNPRIVYGEQEEPSFRMQR